MATNFATWSVTVYHEDDIDMESVVVAIMRGFKLDLFEASHYMMQLHHIGRATFGPFTRDIAQTKAMAYMDQADVIGCYTRCDVHEH